MRGRVDYDLDRQPLEKNREEVRATSFGDIHSSSLPIPTSRTAHQGEREKRPHCSRRQGETILILTDPNFCKRSVASQSPVKLKRHPPPLPHGLALVAFFAGAFFGAAFAFGFFSLIILSLPMSSPDASSSSSPSSDSCMNIKSVQYEGEEERNAREQRPRDLVQHLRSSSSLLVQSSACGTPQGVPFCCT